VKEIRRREGEEKEREREARRKADQKEEF
jgi:hypothetical protein